jgi:hypothetical protein
LTYRHRFRYVAREGAAFSFIVETDRSLMLQPEQRRRAHRPRDARDLERARRAAEAARDATTGGAARPVLAAALAAIEAAFSQAAVVNDLKIAVERHIRRGPDHLAVRARFAARAGLLHGRGLDAAIVTEKILDSLPDSEDDGSLAAQFALNAGLVAADIAGLAEDGENTHVIEAIEYARDSIHAKAASEMRTLVYDPTVEEAVSTHPLVHKERQREEEDLTFLGSFPEGPWLQNAVSMLRDRAQAQETLLGTMR